MLELVANGVTGQVGLVVEAEMRVVVLAQIDTVGIAAIVAVVEYRGGRARRPLHIRRNNAARRLSSHNTECSHYEQQRHGIKYKWHIKLFYFLSICIFFSIFMFSFCVVL